MVVAAYEQRLELQQLHMEAFFPEQTNNLSKLINLSQQQVKRLGYDYFNYMAYFPMCDKSHEIGSFPEDWYLAGNSNKFSSVNPISELCQHRTLPFLWEDIRSQSNMRQDQLGTLLSDAERHGVYDGICIPVHGVGSEWGMLNIARDHVQASNSFETNQLLQLFATTLHEAVKRANAYHIKERTREKTLSPREKECLDWIAAGKTAWETAQIIGVTESTVAFHIRNTINKLNASNRAHAVALAMARSLIHTPCPKN